MTRITISAEEAARLLPRGKKVHTVIRIFGWMGADVARDKVLAAFEAVKHVEISPDAALFDHHLAVKMDGVLTYIDTNQTALRKLRPQFSGK